MPASNPEFPTRLMEGKGRAAGVIQRALAEPVIGPSEAQSWRRLQSRNTRPLLRGRGLVIAFALAVLVLLVCFARLQPETTAAHCAKLASDGRYDAATLCYDRVARGSG